MSAFSGKIVIVTGAASGIGKAAALEMARRGAVLVLADRDAKGLEQTSAMIAQAGGKAEALTLDVTDAVAVEKMVLDTAAKHGRLDLIFNNAGIAIAGDAADMTLADWQKTIAVNLNGVVHGVAAAYPLMVKQGHGHIVSTASVAGLAPSPNLAPYAATKHAVVGLSTTLRAEGAGWGVKVSVVCPGVIWTPLVHNLEIKREKEYGFDSRDSFIEELMPFKPATPERAATVICNGIESNKAIIVITLHARIMWWTYRLCPAFAIWLNSLAMSYARKKFRKFK